MLKNLGLALPVARPLKRSASTASLPTPPRTRRRRKVRLGSNVPSDSESDSVALLSDDEVVEESPVGRMVQKGRVQRSSGSGHEEEEEEDEFWLGSEHSKTSDASRRKIRESDDDERSPSSSPVPLLLRRKQQAATSLGAAPVSPPPSRRVIRHLPRKYASKGTDSSAPPSATASPEADTPSTASPPVTPDNKLKTRAKKRVVQPLLTDSPDNPFVDRDEDSDAVGQDQWDSDRDEQRAPYEEKPTLTYVFRGVRTQFLNPLYDHANRRPLPPDPGSLLPPDHPDYAGDLTCPPKLLFPQAQRRRLPTRVRPSCPPPPRDPDSSDDDDESDGLLGRIQLPVGMAGAPGPERAPRVARLRSPRRRASGRGFAVAGVGS